MNFDRYIGLPWIDHGGDFSGVDCWGLLRLVYRNELGIELPSYSEKYARDADRRDIAALIAGEREPWDEIAQGHEQTFDGVLMRDGNVARHIGIVARSGRVLHVEHRRPSLIENYRAGTLRPRIVGFFRYRQK